MPANLAEAYRKRRDLAAFIAKLTDCDGENAETDVHLDTALACNYITPDEHAPAAALSAEVGRLLNDMMNNPGKYGVKARLSRQEARPAFSVVSLPSTTQLPTATCPTEETQDPGPAPGPSGT